MRCCQRRRDLEEQGFDQRCQLFLRCHAAPGPTELGKRYYDVMDPFVTLTAAACATKRLKVATGICLLSDDPGTHGRTAPRPCSNT
jgi:alkanesulfonate monooxygenase SsuD/methylene tetrahydromethanopterin reductase-like flavin-dependent oxidoreductase (luciferase family)